MKVKTKKVEEKVEEEKPSNPEVKEDGGEEDMEIQKIQQMRTMMDSNIEYKYNLLSLIQKLNENQTAQTKTLKEIGLVLVSIGEILEAKLSTE
tara:strand:+ start:687 stop:965 length:279 start_codon:yes stop_codon:yes gene_type:complete